MIGLSCLSGEELLKRNEAREAGSELAIVSFHQYAFDILVSVCDVGSSSISISLMIDSMPWTSRTAWTGIWLTRRGVSFSPISLALLYLHRFRTWDSWSASTSMSWLLGAKRVSIANGYLAARFSPVLIRGIFGLDLRLWEAAVPCRGEDPGTEFLRVVLFRFEPEAAILETSSVQKLQELPGFSTFWKMADFDRVVLIVLWKE